MHGLSLIASIALPVLVALVLATGLIGFATNADWYRRHAHTLMKLRVSAQFLALIALITIMALR